MAHLSRTVVRIRQVRPEFFSDPTVSHLSPETRLTYIGLWCVADDAGWLEFDSDHVAALLYPYESVRVRTRRVERARDELVETARMMLYPCGCALIPTLETHQKIGGNKSFTVRDRHESRHSRTSTPVGSNGRYVGSPARDRDAARGTDDDELRRAFARQGLPVERAS